MAWRLASGMLVLASVLASVLSTASPKVAHVDRSGPTVSDISGRVFFMGPGEHTWKLLKRGQSIPRDSVLYVSPEARLRYGYQQTGGLPVFASVATSSVFRVTGDEIRPTSLQQITIEKDDLTEVERLQKAPGQAQPSLALPFAWRRFAFALAPEVARYLTSVTQRAPVKEKESAVSGFRAEAGLRIVSPRGKSVTATRTWPAELDIQWRRLNAMPNNALDTSIENKAEANVYRVYVWRSGTARPVSPHAITRRLDHRLFVASPGSWQIQVDELSNESRLTASSQVVRVSVLQDELAGMQKAGTGGLGKSSPPSPIRLDMPRDHLVQVTGKVPARVDMVWQNSQSLARGEHYVIELTSLPKGKPQRHETDRPPLSLMIKTHGSYRWRVGIAAPERREILSWSEWNTFDLRSRSADPFKDLLARSHGGIVYLDAGL